MPDTPPPAGVFVFDDFELDVPAFELRRRGEPIAMEPQVFEVLAFLVENAGKVLTKDEILDRVWPERYVSEASLNVRVMGARKAIGDSGSEQRYIKTIHGRGYRFIGPARTIDSAPPAEFPVAAVQPPGPSVLGTSFIGRLQELARISALLAQPSCRLLTITGPGGIGKTRIALELVSASNSKVPEPVFVPLEHCEPHLLAAAVATSLGIQFGAGDAAAGVVSYLSANPRTLILDNAEHAVIEARALTEMILNATRESRIIVTSRVILGLGQEWIFRIEGLALGASDPVHGAPGEAETLFIERARRAGVNLDSPEATAAVHEVCAYVEGLPLAVELAAALARYVPPSGILQMLTSGAAALLEAAHGVPERHRSLEALFNESLRHLEPAECEALGALAAFEGPFDTAAARAVAGAGLRDLHLLVDASLVQAREGHFSLHPLLREHLRALGSEGHSEAHAAYFAARTAECGPALQGRGQLEAVEGMEVNATNAIAAWRWAAAESRVDLLEEMRQELFTFLIYRGRFLEANELAALALPALESGEHPQTAAGLAVHHAWIKLRIGQPGAAFDSLQRALSATRAAEIQWMPGFGSDPRLVQVVMRVGSGDYPGGLALATRALELAEAAGDEAGVAFSAWLAAVCLNRMGEVECTIDTNGHTQYRPADGETRFDEAAAYLERATTILEAQGELWLRAYVETERGLNAGSQGNREAGCAHHRTSYRLRSQLDDPQGMASALMYLADALIEMRLLDEAAACREEMRSLLLRCADATGNAELLRTSGIAAFAAGDLEGARASLRDALEVSRELGFANNVAGSLRALGDVFLAEGRTDLAGRIMQAVAADPSTTPGSRATARMACRNLGLDVPAVSPMNQVDALIDEAVRVSASLGDWLAPAADPRPFPMRVAVTASRAS